MKTSRHLQLVLVSLFLSVPGFSQVPLDRANSEEGSIDWKVPVAANEIKLMSYNVENLFDALHDEGKSDFEFLPKDHPEKKNCASQGNFANSCFNTNWTTPKVRIKLERIKQVVDAQGALPDILTLNEVENSKVTERLAPVLGYTQFRITESPDARGIDNVIFFKEAKINLVDFRERQVVGKGLRTRNLAVAHFRFRKSFGEVGVLAVYLNHWPSQGKDSNSRVEVARQLKDFIEENRKSFKGEKYMVVLTGDFNTVDADSPHPFKEVIYDKAWDLRFQDAHSLAKKSGHPLLDVMPPASYFYSKNGEWNEFDHFFLSRDLTDGAGLDIDPHSYRILAADFMTRPSKFGPVPKRYEHEAEDADLHGYSDHFPVIVKLRRGK